MKIYTSYDTGILDRRWHVCIVHTGAWSESLDHLNDVDFVPQFTVRMRQRLGRSFLISALSDREVSWNSSQIVNKEANKKKSSIKRETWK